MNITRVMRIFPRNPIKCRFILTYSIDDLSLLQKQVALLILFDSTQPTQVGKNYKCCHRRRGLLILYKLTNI